MPRPRRAFVALSIVAAVASTSVLTGCSTTVSMTPAPSANAPECAQVMVSLPRTVGGLDRRWTDAQATAAWGDGSSSAVLLTCGVATPGPSTFPCRENAGVDWLIDDTDPDRYTVTTFNRTPSVQLYIDNTAVNAAAVLDDLSRTVAVLPANGAACTDISGADQG